MSKTLLDTIIECDSEIEYHMSCILACNSLPARKRVTATCRAHEMIGALEAVRKVLVRQAFLDGVVTAPAPTPGQHGA